jgi:glycosyltransferase involved in cell wall biosynthesis
LESIKKSVVPDEWTVELLVVDNGSTDNTRAVTEDVRFDKLRLRHLYESKSGLSFARNSGLAASAGEIIIFTDDDVRVPSNWIAGMVGPIAERRADAVAGGVIFPNHLDGLFAANGLEDRRGWFAATDDLDRRHPNRLVGANMAFHRRVLKKVREFDVELGAGALGYHEETLFAYQLAAAGFKLVGALDVAVEHHFDAGRLAVDAMLEAARKMGRSRAFMFHHWHHQKSRLVVPRLLLCHLECFWFRNFQRKNKACGEALDRMIDLEYQLAFYREYINQRRRPFKYSEAGLV